MLITFYWGCFVWKIRFYTLAKMLRKTGKKIKVQRLRNVHEQLRINMFSFQYAIKVATVRIYLFCQPRNSLSVLLQLPKNQRPYVNIVLHRIFISFNEKIIVVGIVAKER